MAKPQEWCACRSNREASHAQLSAHAYKLKLQTISRDAEKWAVTSEQKSGRGVTITVSFFRVDGKKETKVGTAEFPSAVRVHQTLCTSPGTLIRARRDRKSRKFDRKKVPMGDDHPQRGPAPSVVKLTPDSEGKVTIPDEAIAFRYGALSDTPDNEGVAVDFFSDSRGKSLVAEITVPDYNSAAKVIGFADKACRSSETNKLKLLPKSLLFVAKQDESSSILTYKPSEETDLLCIPELNADFSRAVISAASTAIKPVVLSYENGVKVCVYRPFKHHGDQINPEKLQIMAREQKEARNMRRPPPSWCTFPADHCDPQSDMSDLNSDPPVPTPIPTISDDGQSESADPDSDFLMSDGEGTEYEMYVKSDDKVNIERKTGLEPVLALDTSTSPRDPEMALLSPAAGELCLPPISNDLPDSERTLDGADPWFRPW